MKNKTDAVELGDYSSILTELSTSAENQASYKVSEAIKEMADIKDERYKFY
jgi:peptidyl-prolyl cis-trans isomerase D